MNLLKEHFSFESQVKIATFKVVKHISPRFEVDVEMSQHLSPQEGSLWAIIRAKDINQAPVRGKVIVSILEKNQSFLSKDIEDKLDDDSFPIPIASYTCDINGHAIVDFRITDLVYFDRWNESEGREYTVMFEITDAATDCSVSIDRTICIHKYPFRINIDKNVFLANDSKYNVKVSDIDCRPMQIHQTQFPIHRYRSVAMITL